MSIVKAEPSDYIEVLYLLKICTQEMYSKGWLFWDMSSLLASDFFKNSTIFLKKENEVCRGLIVLQESYEDNYDSKKSLLIHSIIVHPFWHHQGLAKQLVRFSEEYARQKGYEQLNLFVFSGNPDAVSLYDKLNYTRKAEVLSDSQQLPFIKFEKQVEK